MRFRDALRRELYYRGQIDYSYWAIQEISNHNGKAEDPMEALTNTSISFDEQQVLNHIEEVKKLASTIIRSKRKLGYDVDRDKEFLKTLKELKTK